MTYEEFLIGTHIIETYLNKKFTENQLKIYYKMLEDLRCDSFIQGLERLLKERVYTNIPPIAEIREYAAALKDGDIFFRCKEAQFMLKTAINKYGKYSSVAFEDPIIHLIIRDLGGWQKLCNMEQEDLENYIKFQFEKAYTVYSKNKTSNIPLYFQGVFTNEPIICIGDKIKIDRWQLAYKHKYNGQLETKKETQGLIDI